MVDRFPTRILLTTSASGDAESALRAAVDLSIKTASELHIAHAWRDFPTYSAPGTVMRLEPELREREAQELLFERLDEVEAAGGEAAGTHFRRGNPVEAILALAGELEAGLIVMGSRELGSVKRLFLGSVSESIVARASCPVLVVRGGSAAWPPAHVVVGDDTSAGAKRAGELGASMASLFEARLLLARAFPLFLDPVEAARVPENAAEPLHVALHRQEMLLETRARALRNNLERRPGIRVREGEAASIIQEAARESRKPSLIAVGRRGRDKLDSFRLGSVSTRILRQSPGPVLICPSRTRR